MNTTYEIPLCFPTLEAFLADDAIKALPFPQKTLTFLWERMVAPGTQHIRIIVKCKGAKSLSGRLEEARLSPPGNTVNYRFHNTDLPVDVPPKDLLAVMLADWITGEMK